MANELANAVVLLGDPTFEKYAKAASVYQARLVVSEASTTPDHAARLRLADAVVTDPDWMTQRAVSILATDPNVNSKGSDVTLIDQSIILTSMASAWTSACQQSAAIRTSAVGGSGMASDCHLRKYHDGLADEAVRAAPPS